MIVELANIYQKSPSWLQQCVRLIPFAYRLGANYRQTLRFLRESDYWNREQHCEYQRRQLEVLLHHTITQVPHYDRYRHLLGKNPFDVLRDIEPITKRQMQESPEDFVVPVARRGKWHTTHTGGSSGYPLTVFLNNDVVEKEWAFITTLWQRVGYRPGDRRVTFRGADFGVDSDVFIKRNPVYNEILCSPFHLSEHHLERYVKLIVNFRPRFLRGYPSALTVLARYIEDRRLTDLPSITALLCGSEGFSAEQRLYLERVFRARLYSWYGMTEKVVLAGECENSTHYHCFPQYGITEIEDRAGNISAKPGSEGEIVGTGFLNRVMPFIRYRLDDHATIIDDHCPICERHQLLLSAVSGHRVQNTIVGKSGARISMTALNLHDDTFRDVRQFQFQQRQPGRVSLHLRVAPGFDEERRQLIWKALTRKTGGEIEYQIEIVDRIEPTGLGKGIYLRQHLDNGDQTTTEYGSGSDATDNHMNNHQGDR